MNSPVMPYTCEICQELVSIFHPTSRGRIPEELNLGTREELQARPECSLCSLVFGFISSVENNESSGSQSTAHNYRAWQQRCLPSNPLGELEMDSKFEVLLQPWELGIEVYATCRARNELNLAPPYLLGELMIYTDHPLLSSSSVGQGISGNALKMQLENCETTHRFSCVESKHHPENRQVLQIIVIDVQNKCLVYMDSVFDCRYIALSYVWGATKMLRAIMSNVVSLLQPNSLVLLKDQVPKVVQDAISVVSMLGERYLWVDALCIVQDDPVTKPGQLSQMDLIYSRSIITIVASNGREATEGLPGIDSNHRLPIAVRIHGVVLSRPALDFADLMGKTVYEKRAWTLQEKVLSRRCLFFTSEQVFFRCNAGIHPENYLEPLIKMTDSTTVSRTNSVNPFSKFVNAVTQSRPLTWIHAMLHYSFILDDYTQRQLSFPSDILVAFDGLGATIISAIGGRIFCALAEPLFDQSLLWFRSPESRLFRRRSTVLVANGSSIIAPSWSWAGWEGHVKNLVAAVVPSATENHGFSGFVYKFEVHTPEGIFHIPQEEDATNDVNNGNYSHQPSPENYSERLPFRTQVLVFATQTVERISFDLEAIKDQQSGIPWLYWITDGLGNRCGALFDELPPNFWIAARAGEPIPRYELILMSFCLLDGRLNYLNYGTRLRYTSPYGKVHSSLYPFGMVDSTIFPLDELSVEHVYHDLPTRGACILLIEWKQGENGSRWAERLSFGVMHIDAWKSMNPYDQVIPLA